MKKGLKIAFWSLFTVSVLVLLYWTETKQASAETQEPDVYIQVSGDNAFLTAEELKERLKRKGFIFTAQNNENLDIPAIEAFLQNMSEIKSAKVYTKLGGTWNIEVEIRTPIARIFNKYNESFYLDDEGVVMLTSDLHTARIVVFNGEIPDRKNSKSVFDIINNDTLKTNQVLDQIYRISKYVCSDPFLRAQIGQVFYQKNGDFVVIPQVGSQKIIFGSARTDEDVAKKFKKLVVFYKEGMPYEGWNTYEEINLKYDKQIVCRKKE